MSSKASTSASASTIAAAALALAGRAAAEGLYTATYLPNTVPNQTEAGTGIQFGENICTQWMPYSQDSLCQTAYFNDITDFCLWGPPYSDGVNATISETERIEVAWCMKPGYGTRVFPDGTFTAIHFLQTPGYLMATGFGDFTKIGIPAGDEGGECDPHGYDGNGNPVGGIFFSNAFNGSGNTYIQMHEWSVYIGATQFCAKICLDGGDSDNLTGARQLCPHIYDEMGCEWVMPYDYSTTGFDSCQGDNGEPAGIEGVSPNYSTWTQGQPNTPKAKPAPSSSLCSTITSLPAHNAAAFTPPANVSGAGGSGATQTAGGKSSDGSSGGSTGSASALVVPAFVAMSGIVLGALAVF